jgi:hypothetical protein
MPKDAKVRRLPTEIVQGESCERFFMGRSPSYGSNLAVLLSTTLLTKFSNSDTTAVLSHDAMWGMFLGGWNFSITLATSFTSPISLSPRRYLN